MIDVEFPFNYLRIQQQIIDAQAAHIKFLQGKVDHLEDQLFPEPAEADCS